MRKNYRYIACLFLAFAFCGCGDDQITNSGSDLIRPPMITVESHVDRPPSFVHYVTPEYPRLARQAGLEGTVTIRAHVDKNGTVAAAEVAARSDTHGFDDASIRCAFENQYSPAIENHKAVEVWIRYTVEFRLTD